MIGSVYASKLLAAGHELVIFARGSRLMELQTEGLILEDAESGLRVVVSVAAVSKLAAEDQVDLVLVPVRSEQLPSTLPILTSMNDGCDVLFFGNTAVHQAQLVATLGDTARLAADHVTLRRMVLATRQAFRALRRDGNAEIPTNLRILYLRLPIVFVIGYWHRVFAGTRGELWFGAHSRAAPEEMHAVAAQLQAVLRRGGRRTPDLDLLLDGLSS